MADFLLELRCEEIPARMQPKAKEDLARLFADALAKAGLTAGSIETFATPRRLALIAKALPHATTAVAEETKGPKIGAPPQALEGFLRKVGLSAQQLTERDGVYFAVVEKPGRATAEVLAETIPAIIRAFPWPKSMRWGAASLSTGSLRWVRPLSGIIALLDDAVVPCEIDGIVSGRTTEGHRFHHSGPVEIADAGGYIETLRTAHVIVHFSERCKLIRDGAAKAAAEAGLALVEDEGLVIENAGLTEWPVPLLGRFDAAFLDVPPEVIQLTARVNQKYFVCEDAQGKLTNAFVCTANIDPVDPAVVVDGNRKVLAARLSDARFFWEQDRKKKLAEHAGGLARITFHEKLGTVADKVDRVAKLARWFCEQGIVQSSPSPMGRGTSGAGGGVASPTEADPSTTSWSPSPSGLGEEQARLANLAEQAARLCKADLVTEMVGEFPELQGLMGGYYARAEGLPDEVADAIRDHYKPVGQGDDVPTAPVTVAVSLADKLDTLVGFFGNKMPPTGSKDPFALRRAAIGVISLWLANNLKTTIHELSARSIETYRGSVAPTLSRMLSIEIAPFSDALPDELSEFFMDRLKVQQREAGVRHDLIDAVFALGGEDDLVRLLARVKALQGFVCTEDGANLLAGYKRAANILKKEKPSPLQGRGRSALSLSKGAEGVGDVSSATSGDSPHPNPSPEGEGLVHTGDEDPLENVDDPDMRAVYAAAAQQNSLSYTPEPAERALIDALDAAEPTAAAAIDAEDFAAAMSALAGLRAPIDAFFEEVTVNADEENKRHARLALLARFRAAVHNVADFSRIEG